MLAINDIHNGRSYRSYGYLPQWYDERYLFEVGNIRNRTKNAYLFDFMF